jgi:hypothetical protein
MLWSVMAVPNKSLNSTMIHITVLIAFSAIIYMPMMGKGFIHDDFVHIAHVAYQPLQDALLRPSGGAFFTPITNLTYLIDWLLWAGERPFPMAAVNLILHLANILLLYALVGRIWKSRPAAFWAALGFSLLFPANIWAILWIATRAHLLAAFFYLLTLHSVLRFAEDRRHVALRLFAVLACASCTILSKESGMTIVAAVPVMLFYCRRARLRQPIVFSDYILLGSLLVVFALYIEARAASGAIGIEFNSAGWYSYVFDWRVILENFLRYCWRTCGLLVLLAASIFLKRKFQGVASRLCSISKWDVIVPALLFILAIAPFLMMKARSGIYSYLPGLWAALLLGAVLHSFSGPDPERKITRFSPALFPVLFVVAVYTVFSFGHGMRWVTMAKTNTSVIRQIKDLQPGVEARSVVLLNYAESDPVHRFPEGLSWGFPFAMRLAYDDPTLNASLVQGSAPVNLKNGNRAVCFEYESQNDSIEIKKIPCESMKIRGKSALIGGKSALVGGKSALVGG